MTFVLRIEINKLIKKHKYIMLKFVDGKVYHLINYHKYLDPEDSEEKFIGYCKELPSGVKFSNRNKNARLLYLTEII